jgi:hypothetical protein
MERLVGEQKQDCVGLLLDPAESRSLLPSIGSGREFCLFVKREAGVRWRDARFFAHSRYRRR